MGNLGLIRQLFAFGIAPWLPENQQARASRSIFNDLPEITQKPNIFFDLGGFLSIILCSYWVGLLP